MAKVFTTAPGLVAHIGAFGLATNDSPATVPDEVAAEFDELEHATRGEEPHPLAGAFRVERDEDEHPEVERPAKSKRARKGQEE